MDFSRIKRLILPAGEAKKIEINGVVFWRKAGIKSLPIIQR